MKKKEKDGNFKWYNFKLKLIALKLKIEFN